MSINLGVAIFNTGVNTTGLNQGLNSGLGQVAKFVIQTDRTLQGVGRGMAQTGAIMSGAITVPLVAAGAAVIGFGSSFESAFADVQKVVQGTDEELQGLRDGIREMANEEVPATREAIAGVAAAAGQLGIETSHILEFTKVMVDLGEATNLSSTEAATALARFANIMQMSQTDFSNLGSAIVNLGNNFATTESEIVSFALRIAPVAPVVGLTETEVLALGTAMSSLGIRAEAGGTAIQRILIKMTEAVRDGGDELALFAEVAGMSVDEFSKLVSDDIGAALLAFETGLGNVNDAGGDTFGILEKLNLDEIRVRQATLALASGHEVLADAMEKSNTGWEDNTALITEVTRRYQTFDSQFKMFKNRLSDVAVTMFDDLRPTLIQLLDVGTKFTGWLGSAVGWFTDLPGPIKTGTLAFLGLLAVIGPLVAGVGLLIFAIGTISTPVLIAAGAAAALGAVAITVAANWDKVRGAIEPVIGPAKALGEALKILGELAIIAIEGIWDTAGNILKAGIAFVDWLTGVYDWLVKLTEKVWEINVELNLPGAGDVGFDFGDLLGVPVGGRDPLELFDTSRLESDVNKVMGWMRGIDDSMNHSSEEADVWEAAYNNAISQITTNLGRGFESQEEFNNAQLQARRIADEAVAAYRGEAAGLGGLSQQAIDTADSLTITGDAAFAFENGVLAAAQAQHQLQSQMQLTGDEAYAMEAAMLDSVYGPTELFGTLYGVFQQLTTPLEQLPMLFANIGAGTLKASEAVTLFIDNGRTGLGDLVDSSSELLTELRDDYAEALGAIGDDYDPALVETLAGQIQAVEEFLAEATKRANEFDASIQFDPNGIKQTMQSIVDANTDLANQDLGYWTKNLGEADDALKKLDEAFERGDISAEEYAKKQELLTWYQARLTEGVEHYEMGVVDATVVEAEHMQNIEKLEEAYKSGAIGPEEYQTTLEQLNKEYKEATNPQAAMIDGMNNLGETMKEVIKGFRDILVELGLLPQDPIEMTAQLKKDLFDKGVTEIENDTLTLGSTVIQPKADVDKEQFDEKTAEIDRNIDLQRKIAVGSGVDTVPFFGGVTDIETSLALERILQSTSALDTIPFFNGLANIDEEIRKSRDFTITPQVNIGPAIASIEGLRGYFTASPAKRGPFKELPTWDAAFNLEDPAQEHGTAATNLLSRYLPMNQPTAGALRGGVSWGFLFEGLDTEAEDYAQKASERIVDFVTGLDLEALATGDLLADANAKLASLFNAKKLAEELNLGQAVVDSIQAQIDAQQERVNAIGAAMGTEVVQGIAESLASGELAAELADFREKVFGGIQLDNLFEDRDNLETSIAEMQTLIAAAEELGDVETANRLAADLKSLQAELALTNQIIGTEAVKAWEANEEAAQSAREEAELYVETFQSLTDPGTYEQLEKNNRDAYLALNAAILSGASPEVIAELKERYNQANLALMTYIDTFRQILSMGLYTQEELIELAKEGGGTLAMVIESGKLTADSALEVAKSSAGGLQAVLEAGLLSDEQVRELIKNADDASRAVLVAFFGEDFVKGVEATFNDISTLSYEQLKALKPQGEKLGKEWVDSIAKGLQDGVLSVEQAMDLLTNEMGDIADEDAIELLGIYEQLQQDRIDALASGDEEAIAAAQAAYDQFMAFLVQFAEQHGLVVDDVIADWERVRAESEKVEKELSGTSIGVGGSRRQVEFKIDNLKDLLESFVGDLDRTLADNVIDLIGAAQAASDFIDPETISDLGDILGNQLSDVGFDDPMSVGAAVLEQLGLTRDDLLQMGLSEDAVNDLQEGLGLDVLEGADSVVDAIHQQTDVIRAGFGLDTENAAGGVLTESVALGPNAAGALTSFQSTADLIQQQNQRSSDLLYQASQTVAQTATFGSNLVTGGAVPERTAPAAAGPSQLEITLEIDKQPFQTLIIDTVSGAVRRDYR